jgi:hypothetical protein
VRLTHWFYLALGAGIVTCACAGATPARAPEGTAREPFGAACEPAPLLPDGSRDLGSNRCGAYLCIDGRCSSCTSDSQCQTELGAPQCLLQPDWPGKRCGRAMPPELEAASPPSDHAQPPSSP